ncbi:hypothetical protein ABB37_05152 [Leptomonas pyrrhocoris]|uniref:Uncharacterized protein n=1 Tax=Leptomonas pyrrhocoris TaxID=157538 RepID=A0A0M9G1B5_LEPPY|nr:hypothetical protein ABB37_05152 [Leptomonas pyrrhocoris]KPA80167.1 hypothetical protein ABB37_05152 [Leptomonas pyrrhocoris]|eukprot:XP_015658606.1 hypothetical protein ABB37_05152 [Leptomonas pyrrhocoris]
MPHSPLIRPLSPLQTQSAPSLPAPYRLADAVVSVRVDAAVAESNAPHASPPASKRSHSNTSSSSQQHYRPEPTPFSVHSHAAAPAFHAFVVKNSAEADAQHSSRSAALFNPAAAPFARARASTGESIQLNVAPSRAGVLEEPQRDVRRRGNHAQHSHGTSLLQSPQPLLPNSLLSENPTRSTTTAASAATLADAVPGALNRSHPYGKLQRSSLAQHDSYAQKSDIGAYGSFHHPDACPSSPPLPTELSAAVTAASVLRASNANVAVAASQPSYGAPLLGRASPGKTSPNFWRRCSSSSPLSQPRRRAARQGAIPTPDKTSTTTLSAVGPTRDEDEVATRRKTAAGPVGASSNSYRGTAVSSRTGRQYSISIKASLLGPDSARATSPPAHEEMRNPVRSSDDEEEEEEDWSSTETVAAEESEENCVPGRRTPAPATKVRSGHRREKTRIKTDAPALSSHRPETHSSSSRCASPQPPLGEPVAPASPAATLSSSPYFPRYVYPALDECQRLLREIQVQNPLLRRCLTPPRPLRDVDSAVAEEGLRMHPTSDVSARHTDHSAFPEPPPSMTTHVGRLAPGPDARRLYSWDARTAAEDLSFMQGPFQQSSERFAASSARQLQRLRETGTRLYGTEVGTQPASISPFTSPPHVSDGVPPSSKRAAPYKQFLHRADSGVGEVESPSGRLRRLLRETEAAFPILWKTTHLPSTSSPTESEGREHGVSDSGSGAFITPSPSAIQLSRGERDVVHRDYEEAAFVKNVRSDLAPRRLNEPSTPFPEEVPTTSTMTALTPARPPPASAPLHSAHAPVALLQRSI